MALKFNGVVPESIKFIDKGVTTLLDKLIYNGVTVWESWQLKTGYYNKMTSSSTPKAFKITANETLYFLEPWQLFDDNWSNRATINISIGATRYIQQDLLSADIIPTKIKVEKTFTRSNGTDGTLTIKVSADGSSWSTFGSVNVQSAYNLSQTFYTMTNTNLTTPIRYIRAEYYNSGDVTQYEFNDIAIVEWYQKGNG